MHSLSFCISFCLSLYFIQSQIGRFNPGAVRQAIDINQSPKKQRERDRGVTEARTHRESARMLIESITLDSEWLLET